MLTATASGKMHHLNAARKVLYGAVFSFVVGAEGIFFKQFSTSDPSLQPGNAIAKLPCLLARKRRASESLAVTELLSGSGGSGAAWAVMALATLALPRQTRKGTSKESTPCLVHNTELQTHGRTVTGAGIE